MPVTGNNRGGLTIDRRAVRSPFAAVESQIGIRDIVAFLANSNRAELESPPAVCTFYYAVIGCCPEHLIAGVENMRISKPA